MATFETTTSTRFAGRLGYTFAALTALFVEWNDKRKTRNALELLSDRELNDIGLSRADIASFR
ncbi:DUF1127 domain-containing protein [Shimia sp. R11_0]|uniref:YjiS-like domain-containing protein n=1 Tax=Shimia marina TaxID=321267 RepID=A0A0N7LSP2_9RHOB|nr:MULTISPECIES: DUF1127 domain-containing protein [Shimia]MBO9478468.1 DUF1127 domain-containing protein [Shimia sp. R11_0]CUH54172.1 hypothetical protein SHM7688_03642 [Shimia marina]SFD97019.1 protein of unknown function [Shimia marina]